MMSHDEPLNEHRCRRCGHKKVVSEFHIDDQGRYGKTCIKCKAASARCSRQRRDRILEERPKSTLPVNSGLSEEQIDERLAAAIKKAVSNHNATWTVRY